MHSDYLNTRLQLSIETLDLVTSFHAVLFTTYPVIPLLLSVPYVALLALFPPSLTFSNLVTSDPLTDTLVFYVIFTFSGYNADHSGIIL